MALVQRHKNATKLFDRGIRRRITPDWPIILTKWDDLNAVQLTVFQDLSKTNLSLDDVVTQ
jgi:hypothetical protein